MASSSTETLLKVVVSTSTDFQTWVGVLSTGSAAERIFLPWATDAEVAAAGSRYAIVGANEDADQDAIGQNAVVDSGSLPLQFEALVLSGTEEEEIRNFSDDVRAIVRDLLNVQEAGGMLIIRGITANGQPMRLAAEEGDAPERFFAQFDCAWGLEPA